MYHRMKQRCLNLNLNDPYSMIDILKEEYVVKLPDKIKEMMIYCIQKIDESGKPDFIYKTGLRFSKHILRMCTHDTLSCKSYYSVNWIIKNRYKRLELYLFNKLKDTDMAYDRFRYDDFISFEIGDWSIRDFLYNIFYILSFLNDFGEEYEIEPFSSWKNSVDAPIQMIQSNTTYSGDQLLPEYIDVIEKFTPEHTLMLLMIVYSLASEVSSQLSYFESHRYDKNYGLHDDEAIGPEDNIKIAEIKKIVYTMTYEEIIDITGWLHGFDHEYIDKIDRIIY